MEATSLWLLGDFLINFEIIFRMFRLLRQNLANYQSSLSFTVVARVLVLDLCKKIAVFKYWDQNVSRQDIVVLAICISTLSLDSSMKILLDNALLFKCLEDRCS